MTQATPASARRRNDHPARRRLPSPGTLHAAPAHVALVALPRGPVRPAHGRRAQGVGRGGARHRPLRARHRGRRPGPGGRGPRVARPGRSGRGVGRSRRDRPPPHPARRLLDPRQRPDLRARRRRQGRDGALRLRRLGRALHALRQGRAGARCHRRGLGRAALRGAVRARGRRLQHRRRGHAAHDRAVPAAQPQPRVQPRRQRDAAQGLARRREGHLAALRPRRGLRAALDLGPRGRRGAVRGARRRTRADVRAGQPELLTAAGEPRGAGGGDGRRRSPPRGRRDRRSCRT